ncbi:LRR domain containing protein [Parasponia andersonii]|uniref:LRR domain containing protein n=1 Tax=Parasponia andersonii TaxID=3476 RepID=A0A2P5AKY3_PARAD|nr:LRR domain containing protein [Parasponia andersonii]
MNLYDLPMLTSDLFEEPKNLHQPHKAFQALENLDIQRCGRLPSLVSFKHLNDLRVSECHGMINLFDLSTAKSLVQLTRMSITRCKRMTEIIGQESETNYDSQTESEIVFGQLKILVIHCLPSLRSFYSGHNIMRLPKLERLIVSHCPEMRCFSDGIVTNNPGMDGNIGEYDEEWVAERFANMSHYFFHLSENAKFDRQLWEGEVNMIVRKVWEEDTCSTLQQLYMVSYLLLFFTF